MTRGRAMNDLDNWGMRPDMGQDYPHPDTYDPRDRGGAVLVVLLMAFVTGMLTGMAFLALILWLFQGGA